MSRANPRETQGAPSTLTSEATGKANETSLSALESHLWEAANILRGPVDAADFKSYVFPLLFFKRLSDVHDEEHATALKEFGGDEESALFPENYGFQVPEGCHWSDVRKVATNVGQALQTALRGIEQANPHTLYGIFGDAQWTNKERLSDALLRDLIEHFSRLSLGNSAAKADVLGQSYEYLIKKFADATNKKAGEFYTPRSVVRLMVNILDPREGESIYDPTCGTGGMLLEAIHHVQDTRGDVRTLWGKLFGQEKNLTTSAIARMNLIELHRAVLPLPAVQRRFADVHVAADGFRRLPLFDPAQDRDDLLRRVLLSFRHVWVSFLPPRLSAAMAQFPCVPSRRDRFRIKPIFRLHRWRKAKLRLSDRYRGHTYWPGRETVRSPTFSKVFSQCRRNAFQTAGGKRSTPLP